MNPKITRRLILPNPRLAIRVSGLISAAGRAFIYLLLGTLVSTPILAQDTAEANELIRKLGSPQFAERQAAAEALWKLGPEIAPVIKQSLNDSDPEVVARLKLMLTAFEAGLDSETPYPIALSVLNFKDREAQVQMKILQNLRVTNQETMLLNLIGQLPGERQAKAFKDHFRLTNILRVKLINRDFKSIDELLGHPLVKKHKPDFYLFWKDLNGKLPECIADQKRVVDALIAKQASIVGNQKLNGKTAPVGGNPNKLEEAKKFQASPRSSTTAGLNSDESQQLKEELQSELRMLFQLYRSTGQQLLALPYTARLLTARDQATMRNQLLMELGDWKSVAKNLVSPDRKPAYETGQINATVSQLVVANYFAGTNEAVTSWLAKLENEFQTLKLKKSPERILDAHQMKLAHCYLLIGDWENAQKWLQANFENSQATTLIAMSKHRDLFDFARYQGDASDRLAWSQKIIQRTRALDRQFERTDNDRFSDKSNRLWDTAELVVGQLNALGLHDEAKYHWQILFANEAAKENSARLMPMIRDAINMGYFELATEALIRTKTLKSIADQGSLLFPSRLETARIYWPRICIQSDSIAEALRLGSQLFHTPLVPIDSNFDPSAMESLRTLDSNTVSSSYFEYYRFFLELYAGRFGDARKRIYDIKPATAATIQFKASLHRSAGEYGRVLDTLSDQSTILSPLLHSYRAEANNRLERFEQAKLDQLAVILNFTHSYRATRHMETYRTNNDLQLAERWLNISVHATPANKLVSENNRRDLAQSRATGDATRCANDWKIFVFNYFKTPTRFMMKSEIELLESVLKAEIVAAASQREWESVRNKSTVHLDLYGPDIDLLLAIQTYADDAPGQRLLGQMVNRHQQVYFDQLLDYPSSPLINNNYAWMLTKLGINLEFAKRHCQIALESQPLNENFLDTMALIEWKSGNRQKAIELQRKCIQQQPSNFVFWKRYFSYGGQLENPTANLDASRTE